MGRKKTKEQEALTCRIETRINTKKFAELEMILKQSQYKDMSKLIRSILYDRKIKIYTQDQTLNNLMEELAKLRTQIKAIGVNINQMTKLFNTYPEIHRKEFYAKIAFEKHLGIEDKIERLLSIISKLSQKWLSE